MKYALAIDIGASSGRGIIGYLKEGKIISEEIYRFDNGVTYQDGHLIWDIDNILFEVKKTIDIALSKYPINSLSIDSWAVDYVLLNKDKTIYPVYAYRDERTEQAIKKVHELISFDKLYQHTGCQFQSFTTIYQLYADKLAFRLDRASDFLMIPEYLMYRLTGNKVKEYTNGTTTGLINYQTLDFDNEIIEALALPKHLFKPLHQPKTIVGKYKNIDVVLCATHDTASAVEAIEMKKNIPYISSGTWSLLGVKTDHIINDVASMVANYSNEGGINYNRYQKNIMGMWLVNQLQKELCPKKDIKEIVSLAQHSDFEEIVDCNKQDFLAPVSMKEAFDKNLKVKTDKLADYFRCAYKSLAYCYKQALDELENNTGKKYDEIVIVGGGAKNQFLNDLVEKETGKKVNALPIEATALGNLKVQLED